MTERGLLISGLGVYYALTVVSQNLLEKRRSPGCNIFGHNGAETDNNHYLDCVSCALCTAAQPSHCSNFTLVNGQIFTPGLAIVDAPQPCTPLGGDFLQVPLDISGNGALPFPASKNDNKTTAIRNITLFLTSYTNQQNFTISNGTTASPAPLGLVLDQEPSSTVKHVNWAWPDCFVNDGSLHNSSQRGAYNISIHQSFRLNGSDYYTVFDLPISVTNAIPSALSSAAGGNNPAPGPLNSDGSRLSCAALQNQLLDPTEIRNSTRAPSTQPYIGGPMSAGATSKMQNLAVGLKICKGFWMFLAAVMVLNV